jgi:Drought induced 19 protein (Di19), zinc-binding
LGCLEILPCYTRWQHSWAVKYYVKNFHSFILVRSFFCCCSVELYFGGEEPNSMAAHHSYTCPYCGRLGLTDASLQEHVDEDHGDETKEVVSVNCFVRILFLDGCLSL